MTPQLSLLPTAGTLVLASISGGRDSAAMSLWLADQGIEHRRVFMDTGWEHPATYDYIRGPLTAALGAIDEIRSPQGFRDLLRSKAMFPSRVRRFCTTELKVLPAQRYIAALQAQGYEVINAVGIRRAESQARSRMEEREWSDSFDCETWRPLIDWSAAQVAEIHARHGLEPNPLYALGASRVGCWPCIHARKAEIALVARVDPGRIREIAELETELTAAAGRRHPGEEVRPRTFFTLGGGGRAHYSMPILQAVEWANSSRGEWHPPSDDGCVRHGVCETEPD